MNPLKSRETQLKALEAKCTKNAASALSRLLKKNITVSRPKIKILKKEELPYKPRELTANVHYNLIDLTCAVILTLKRRDSLRLVDMCLGRKDGSTGTLSGFELSAFLEISSILTANYIATIANFFGTKIMHTAPVPVFNIAEKISGFAHIGKKERMTNAFTVRITLSAGKRKMPVHYIVLLSERSLEKIAGWTKK